MNILALDSFSVYLSVAVYKDGEIFYEETEAGVKHSEIIIDFMDSLIKKAGIKTDQLNAVVCMEGPGSFTGLRLGFSAAKALALCHGISFAAIPTLDCVAYPFLQETSSLILPIIQAGKNAWFYSLFFGDKKLLPCAEGQTADILQEIAKFNDKKTEKIKITGTGALSFLESLDCNQAQEFSLCGENKGYARELIAIAKNMNISDNDNNAYLFKGPLYIKKAVTEEK